MTFRKGFAAGVALTLAILLIAVPWDTWSIVLFNYNGGGDALRTLALSSPVQCNEKKKTSRPQQQQQSTQPSSTTTTTIVSSYYGGATTTTVLVEEEEEDNGAWSIEKVFEQEHCVVHIHGIHHTGTGYLRQTIYESLGEEIASKHEATHKSEDEGQHIQTVYPAFRNRNKKNCRSPSSSSSSSASSLEQRPVKNAQKYYCPVLATRPIQPAARHHLFQQWSQYWDMTKPYLLQKTPTLDVLFLERMKLGPTTHVAVMRHPFLTRGGNAQRKLQKWLDVWSHALAHIVEHEIEAYAIVNYEALVLHHEQVQTELSTIIKEDCGGKLANLDSSGTANGEHNNRSSSSSDDDDEENEYNDDDQSTTARRLRRQPPQRFLHLHKNIQNASKYLKLSNDQITMWKECQTDVQSSCGTILRQMEPILSAMGYAAFDWEVPFSLPTTTRERGESKLVFSSRNPPSRDLVRQMKDLCAKYC